MVRVAIVGGGPAGLMAAEQLVAVNGLEVAIFDAMPTVGRKFLMAGKGGMNITHAEPAPAFIARYGERAGVLAPLLAAFGPDALREWIHGLGIETFVGSSGRVFPREMKAAPLLRAWLHRLRRQGARLHVRHRWLGWQADGRLRFATPDGEIAVAADAVILALGGGSWAHLGSDGAWVDLLAVRGIPVAPLKPANCGFDVGWSGHFAGRFAGQPVKPVVAAFAGRRQQGEFTITAGGVEGGVIYALAAPLRDALEAAGRPCWMSTSRPAARWHGWPPISRGRAGATRSPTTCAGGPGSPASRPACCANCACRRSRPRLTGWRRRSSTCRCRSSPRGRSTRRSAAPAASTSRRWMTS